jgi:hypothetical protein
MSTIFFRFKVKSSKRIIFFPPLKQSRQFFATDPGVLHDIPAWCKVHGHKVLACDEKTDEIVLMVEKI